MSLLRFKALVLALSLSPHLLLAAKDPFMGERLKSKTEDKNVLTGKINSLLPAVDSLARRTRSLSEKRRKEIAQSIKTDFHLNRVGNALDAIRSNEKLLETQDALTALMTQVVDPSFEKKVNKLEDKEKDLKTDIRDAVRYIVKGATEEEVLAFQNWLMVNEGLLAKEQIATMPLPSPSPTFSPSPSPSPTPEPKSKTYPKRAKKKTAKI